MKRTLKLVLGLLLLCFSWTGIAAQVAINTDNAAPDTSAILDIKSTNKGVLLPRMTTAQRDSIAGPSVGLTIFNLDDQCTDIFDGTNWMKDCPLKISADSLAVGFWTQKPSFPLARTQAVGFAINGKLYIGTGFNSNGFSTDDFWEFDPGTNTWTQKADFPGNPRNSAVGFSINGKGYIGTGTTGQLGSAFSDFYEYDPTTNIWTQKADFQGGPRSGAVGFSINGKGYIGTGVSSNGDGTDFWEYDPSTNGWTPKASIPGGSRTNATSFTIDGKAYVAAGSSVSPEAFYEFDPALNTWIRRADLLIPAREGAAGFSVNGRGFVGLGAVPGNTVFKDFWKYNPATDTWIQQEDFPGTARGFSISISDGEKGYIGMGFDNSTPLSDFWEFRLVNSPIYQASNPLNGIVRQNSTVFDNDSDTKIQVEESFDEDIIRFDVAGAEAMVIDQLGKVGINTSAPQTELEVNGTITATSFTEMAPT